MSALELLLDRAKRGVAGAREDLRKALIRSVGPIVRQGTRGRGVSPALARWLERRGAVPSNPNESTTRELCERLSDDLLRHLPVSVTEMCAEETIADGG